MRTFYHYTNPRNVPSILEYGLLSRYAQLAGMIFLVDNKIEMFERRSMQEIKARLNVTLPDDWPLMAPYAQYMDSFHPRDIIRPFFSYMTALNIPPEYITIGEP